MQKVHLNISNNEIKGNEKKCNTTPKKVIIISFFVISAILTFFDVPFIGLVFYENAFMQESNKPIKILLLLDYILVFILSLVEVAGLWIKLKRRDAYYEMPTRFSLGSFPIILAFCCEIHIIFRIIYMLIEVKESWMPKFLLITGCIRGLPGLLLLIVFAYKILLRKKISYFDRKLNIEIKFSMNAEPYKNLKKCFLCNKMQNLFISGQIVFHSECLYNYLKKENIQKIMNDFGVKIWKSNFKGVIIVFLKLDGKIILNEPHAGNNYDVLDTVLMYNQNNKIVLVDTKNQKQIENFTPNLLINSLKLRFKYIYRFLMKFAIVDREGNFYLYARFCTSYGIVAKNAVFYKFFYQPYFYQYSLTSYRPNSTRLEQPFYILNERYAIWTENIGQPLRCYFKDLLDGEGNIQRGRFLLPSDAKKQKTHKYKEICPGIIEICPHFYFNISEEIQQKTNNNDIKKKKYKI